MRIKSLLSIFSLAICATSVDIQAGELLFTNGDRVQGELLVIDKANVTWRSENFGDLTVAKARIANMSVDKPVVIQGQRDTCTVIGMEKQFLAYRCGTSSYVQRTELLSLASVEPFVENREKNYEYYGEMAISGVFSRGNTEEDDLDVFASTTFRQGNFRHVTTIDVDTLSTGDNPATEDYEVGYRLDWFFSEKWFWYNALTGGRTESKSIKEFYNYGTGLGVQMWENVNSALALESGIDFIKERYEQPDDPMVEPTDDLEKAAWRFATRYRYKLPWFNAKLVHKNEVLYSFEDSADWEVSADVGVSVPLGPGLFSEYMIEYDYDNLPAEGAKSADTKVTIGIGYKW